MKDSRRSFLLEPPTRPMMAGVAFLRHSRFRLREDYLEKIRRSVGMLDDKQIWSRLNWESNSIGNLMLHLAGNLRQWVICGIGGEPDKRERSLEFSANESRTGVDLLKLVESTIEEADLVLARLEEESEESEAALKRIIVPQGYSQTVLDALFHVVEHFSYHTGQIVMLAKWQKGSALALYDDKELENG
ncbi:MAG: DinB family protein [Acidobacteriota bacterium]